MLLRHSARLKSSRPIIRLIKLDRVTSIRSSCLRLCELRLITNHFRDGSIVRPLPYSDWLSVLENEVFGSSAHRTIRYQWDLWQEKIKLVNVFTAASKLKHVGTVNSVLFEKVSNQTVKRLWNQGIDQQPLLIWEALWSLKDQWPPCKSKPRDVVTATRQDIRSMIQPSSGVLE
jgi:hypothetical protein